MSKCISKKISGNDKSASTCSKDKLDNSYDEKSEEGSVTSSHEHFSDDSSLESDSSLHSSEDEVSEKDIICHFCDKRFANKGSLASHKSRFHRESNGDSVTSPASKEKVKDLLSSEEETYSDTDMQSTTDSTSASDNDQKSDSDHNTDNASTRRSYRLKRKERTNLVSSNTELTKILKSIKQVLQSKNCIEKGDCFDLLSSYELKTVVFAELGDYIKHKHGMDINMVLSENELRFVDAVLSTKSLTEITRLLNENTEIVKSILEEHVLSKRRKNE